MDDTDDVPLPPNVTSALAALVPHDALSHTLRPRSRAPGSLSWRHVPVDAAEAADLLGGPVPVLPALRSPGIVEHLSVHRGAPGEPLRDQVAAGRVTLHLRTCWLPEGLSWERAHRWPSVLHGASVLDVWAQDPRPRPHPPWTDRLARRTDAGGGDHTVVRVQDADVGVQVDLSGVVHLTWAVPRSAGDLPAALLTRRGPRAAVELLGDAGLLTRG
ncbi:hypothetical protein AB1207_00430 [Kineococcus endophyticus]|uniref:Uncharacterized protein n=1 Tax=Kineococcus endophyticus TaxID=1181883 RepID=A0ABV3P0S1_9ACTN